MRISVLGAGAVGGAVARLAPEYGHDVVGLADSRGAVTAPDGVDVDGALSRKDAGEPVGDEEPGAALEVEADAVVEATPTTLGDAEPGFGHVQRALDRDRHVALANKGPVAERYEDLQSLAAESGGELRFEATVAGAIPAIATIVDYGTAQVEAVRGVLNGTANFILSRMAAEGLGYEHVLAEAQDLGVAEADPTFDVDGTDAALKGVIVANVLADGGFALDDADVQGITAVPGSALDVAAEDGRTVRLIGEATRDGVSVAPRLVPRSGPLAVSGTRNIVQIDTRYGGRLNLSGRGAGGPETATAVMADLHRLPG